MYGEGISLQGEIIEQGVNLNLIEKAGAWYSYQGDKIGQGKDNVREFLKQNPEIAQTLEDQIRDNANLANKKMIVEPGDSTSSDEDDAS